MAGSGAGAVGLLVRLQRLDDAAGAWVRSHPRALVIAFVSVYLVLALSALIAQGPGRALVLLSPLLLGFMVALVGHVRRSP